MTSDLLQCETPNQSRDDESITTMPGRACALALSSAVKTVEQTVVEVADELRISKSMRFRILIAGRPKPVSSTVEKEMYRIAREALLNALRHSKAQSIEAEIEYLPSKFRMVVRDNGCGMSSQVIAGNSHGGLVEMRKRAGKVGGELRVWSRRGAGTEVEVCVPGHLA